MHTSLCGVGSVSAANSANPHHPVSQEFCPSLQNEPYWDPVENHHCILGSAAVTVIYFALSEIVLTVEYYEMGWGGILIGRGHDSHSGASTQLGVMAKAKEHCHPVVPVDFHTFRKWYF